MVQRSRSILPRLLVLTFISILLCGPLRSQTAVPDKNGRLVFKANARTVVLDVVITGRDGKPLEGLHKEDFTVTEDGHPQTLTFFEEQTGAHPLQANLPALPPNIFTNIPRVPPSDAVTVLLLDGLNTQLSDQSNVRAKMLQYVKDMQPGQRMAIFTLSTRLRYVQGFTDDPALLASVLKTQKNGAGQESSAVLQSRAEIAVDQQTIANMVNGHALAAATALKQFQAEQSTSQTALRAQMTLEALQELAQYLAGIPGRKNLVWFSSAFPLVLFPNQDLTDAFATNRDFGEKVRKTDALLAEAQVAVYPVGAESLTTGSLYDSDQRAGAVVSGQMAAEPSPGQIAANPSPAAQATIEENNSVKFDAVQRNANHTTMDEIARETGGKAFYNTNGLNDALARIADSGSYFYTMTYTPTNTAAYGKFRKIQVKLSREDSGSGAKLAYRRGYYAADAKEIKAEAAKPPGDPLHPFMGPGMPASTQIPLALRLQRIAAQPGAGVPGDAPPLQARNQVPPAKPAGDNPDLKAPLTRYRVDFVIAASGLQLDPAPDSSRHGKIEATIVIYNREGVAVNWTVRNVNLDMDAARHAQVKANGVNFSLDIDVPKDGVTLRGGVFDLNADLAGTLEIPLSSVVGPAQNSHL